MLSSLVVVVFPSGKRREAKDQRQGSYDLPLFCLMNFGCLRLAATTW